MPGEWNSAGSFQSKTLANLTQNTFVRDSYQFNKYSNFTSSRNSLTEKPPVGRLKVAPSFCVAEANQADTTWHWTRLQAIRLTQSWPFKVGIAVIILVNLCYVIYETDASARGDTLPMNGMISFAFLCIYAAEILFRFYAFRTQLFVDRWNQCDCLIVTVDLVGWVAVAAYGPLEDLQEKVSLLPAVRALRILRAVRVFRVLMVFRDLYMMIHGLYSATRAVLWSTVMIAVMLLLWSILAVNIVHPVNMKIAEEGRYDGCSRCPRAYSSVFMAFLTFMQTIVAGDSWGQTNVPLIEDSPGLMFILVPALLTVQLGLMNLVLAVIVDRAEEARRDDAMQILEQKRKKYKEMSTKLMQMCTDLDVNKDGVITYKELVMGIETHDEFAKHLALLDVTRADVDVLFDVLDRDGSGDVNYEEFIENLYQMQECEIQTKVSFIKLHTHKMKKALEATVEILREAVQERDRCIEKRSEEQMAKLRQVLEQSVQSTPSNPRKRLPGSPFASEDKNCEQFQSSKEAKGKRLSRPRCKFQAAGQNGNETVSDSLQDIVTEHVYETFQQLDQRDVLKFHVDSVTNELAALVAPHKMHDGTRQHVETALADVDIAVGPGGGTTPAVKRAGHKHQGQAVSLKPVGADLAPSPRFDW